QAKVSFEEFYEMVQNNQLENTRDNKGFYNLTKLMITGLDTNSTFKFATSNAKTKDGGRQGFIIYDEIHQYEDRQIVRSEEHTSELQSRFDLVCRLLLEK